MIRYKGTTTNTGNNAFLRRVSAKQRSDAKDRLDAIGLALLRRRVVIRLAQLLLVRRRQRSTTEQLQHVQPPPELELLPAAATAAQHRQPGLFRQPVRGQRQLPANVANSRQLLCCALLQLWQTGQSMAQFG